MGAKETARTATGRGAAGAGSAAPPWLLALIGGGEALIAAALGYPDAAAGAVAGTAVAMVNHGLTRWAVRRWEATGTGAGWVLAGSMARLALAGGLLWWAAAMGVAFLMGALAGVLVDLAGYLAVAAREWKANGR